MLHEETTWHETEPDRLIVRFCDERGWDWVRVEYENRANSQAPDKYETRITWSSGHASPDDDGLYQMQTALQRALEYARALDVEEVPSYDLHKQISGQSHA